MLHNELKWKDYISVFIDTGICMTGWIKGIVAKVCEINPYIRCNHCLIHHAAIVAKSLPSCPNINLCAGQSIICHEPHQTSKYALTYLSDIFVHLDELKRKI